MSARWGQAEDSVHCSKEARQPHRGTDRNTASHWKEGSCCKPHCIADKLLQWYPYICPIPAEAIPTALAEAETAKAAIAGMALLTTAAAPGNQIDISDPRVAEWLAVSGVSVEQVKAKMEELANAQIS